MLTLIDKAKSTVSEEEIEDLETRAKRGTLTLEDFLAQFQRVKKMGPLSQIIGMVPGLSTIANRMAVEELDEHYLNRLEAIVYSMTLEERRHPDVIDASRRRRIARGSGTQPADVNRLLKQYREAKKIMQMVASGRGGRIAAGLRWPL